jgi:hypothetical protein
MKLNLGFIVRGLYWGKEKIAIQRYQESSELGRHRIFFELIKYRIRFLVLLFTLIGISWAIDSQVTNNYSTILLRYFPSIQTMETILAAIIGGTAAILAILISISLVMLQMASAQYRNRMVRFLIDEKVSNYVPDLLAVDLLFSLWVLFSLKTNILVPFFGLSISCLLATVSVSSLMTYRRHALSIVQPREAMQVMLSEYNRLLPKVADPNKHQALSIENYIHDRVVRIIGDMSELATTLLKDRMDDSEGANAIIGMCRVIEQYCRHKRNIPSDCMWFPMHEVILTPQDGYEYLDMKRMYDRFGLGEPHKSQHDQQWLEQRMFSYLIGLRETINKGAYPLSNLAYVTGIGNILEVSFKEQEFKTLDMALSEMQHMDDSLQEENLNSWGSELMNTLIKFVYLVLEGLDTSRVEKALERISWHAKKEIHSLRLPRFFQDHLLAYQEKLETELLVEGHLVTPDGHIRLDINEAVSRQENETIFNYCNWTIKQFDSIKSRSIKGSSVLLAGNSCYMQTLILHRALAKDRPDIILANLEIALDKFEETYSLLDKQKQLRQGIFNELRTLSLLLMRQGNEQASSRVVTTFIRICAIEISFKDTEMVNEALDGLLVVGSLSFLVSELNPGNKSLDVVEQATKGNFKLLELVKALEAMTNIKGYGIRWGTSVIMKYFDYFQPLFNVIMEMPKRPVDTDRSGPSTISIPYEVADHPSRFVQRHSQYPIGPEISDCAEEFIERLKTNLPHINNNDEAES